MTCYDCGLTVKKAVRQFRESKDRRGKAGFRDICEKCYDAMRQTGQRKEQP